jgi:DNA-binding NtrC family response regulator
MFPRFDIDSGDIAYEGTLEDMEKKLITDAIKRFEGNMTAVASQLGITRQTLYNKIRRYGL